MKMTVITLYRGHSCETYVGAVVGELTEAQKAEYARKLDLEVGDLDGEKEALDIVGFTVCEVSDALPDTLHNAYQESYDGT